MSYSYEIDFFRALTNVGGPFANYFYPEDINDVPALEVEASSHRFRVCLKFQNFEGTDVLNTSTCRSVSEIYHFLCDVIANGGQKIEWIELQFEYIRDYDKFLKNYYAMLDRKSVV